MRIFVAGASGVIGVHLVPLLVASGHAVAGMTRSPGKAERLAALGAEPVVCDVYDADALRDAVAGFRPEAVIHQLTDLPDDKAQLAGSMERNSRIRSEGTRNLVGAATAAGATRFVAQSIAWTLAPDRQAAIDAHEDMVLAIGGVVARYGTFYGPGTYNEATTPPAPHVHVEEAARQTVPLLDVPSGVVTIVD